MRSRARNDPHFEYTNGLQFSLTEKEIVIYKLEEQLLPGFVTTTKNIYFEKRFVMIFH